MTEDKNLAEDFTIEESIKELDLIVQRLESREISLEDSFVTVSYTHLTLPTNSRV